MLAQDTLNFFQLDPEATHLHLVIDAAAIIDLAILFEASEIAGAVQSFARLVREWIWNK
jgi:hypothetical protein